MPLFGFAGSAVTPYSAFELARIEVMTPLRYKQHKNLARKGKPSGQHRMGYALRPGPTHLQHTATQGAGATATQRGGVYHPRVASRARVPLAKGKS